jgi:hypothetical protein
VSLRDEKEMGTRAEEARVFMGDTVQKEYEGRPSIHLTTIRNACLDKLLIDILNPENHPNPPPNEFCADMSIARSLQRQWRTRFRGAYFDIDQSRYQSLHKHGRLKGVCFDDTNQNNTRLWRPESCETIAELGGNLQFEAGQYVYHLTIQEDLM